MTRLPPWQQGGPICEGCGHVHLGSFGYCFNSENREHLCLCFRLIAEGA